MEDRIYYQLAAKLLIQFLELMKAQLAGLLTLPLEDTAIMPVTILYPGARQPDFHRIILMPNLKLI